MISSRQGILLLLFATVALGIVPILIVRVDVEPLSIAALRCLLALPMLAPLVIWELRRSGTKDALPPRTMVGAAVAGVALGIDYSFWNFSIVLIGPGLATVLLNIQLVILPLVAWLLEGTRPMRQLALIIPVMMTGVALMSGILDVGELHVAGVLAGLIAGCGYATYLAVIRRTAASTARQAPFTVLAIACASAGVTALIASLVTGTSELPGSWLDWGGLLMITFVGQVLFFICLNVAMTALNETVTSALLLLTGVFATLLGAVLLRDIPTPWQLLGCAMIIGGAWCASRAHRRTAELRVAATG